MSEMVPEVRCEELEHIAPVAPYTTVRDWNNIGLGGCKGGNCSFSRINPHLGGTAIIFRFIFVVIFHIRFLFDCMISLRIFSLHGIGASCFYCITSKKLRMGNKSPLRVPLLLVFGFAMFSSKTSAFLNASFNSVRSFPTTLRNSCMTASAESCTSVVYQQTKSS